MAVKTYSYATVPTIRKFNKDLSFITALMGPFGSGKSSGCVIKLVERAMAQEPGPDGVRRTRWAIVRNSYPQLRDTTIPTTLEWIGELGEHKQTDYDFILNKLTAPDGSPVEAKFHFRALDKPQDIKNLLSLELTGAWFNEVREIPKRIVDAMRGRVGRFPKKDLEHNFHGPTWHGILMDTNPPDTDHWFYKLFEVDRPHFCPKCRDTQGGIVVFVDGRCPRCKTDVGIPFSVIYKQPSGRGGDAENLPHLPIGYYANLGAGMDKDFVRVYVDGQYGYVTDGKPVYPMFDDDKHVAKEKLKADGRYPIIIGFDNTGRDQAAIVCQYMPNGQFRVLHEFIITDVGTRTLVREVVRPFILTNYPGCKLILTGDPAGIRKSDTDDRDTFQEIYDGFGIEATPARSNALAPRLNAVESFMKKYLGKNNYGLLVSPDCPLVIKGFRGEYRLRRLQVVGQERYTDKPEKNLVSHGHDALQYACMSVEDALTLTSRGSLTEQEGSGNDSARVSNWDAFT
jgi:hypothetical protein